MTVEMKDIKLIQPIPLHHMKPIGYLPMTPEAAALWQFLLMAFQAIDRVEKQVTYEGDEDQTVDLLQLAHSARKLFELPESGGLERMFATALITAARLEAKRSGLSWNTKIDGFFESGGTSYRMFTRNPDKVGH